jgi:radical SAM superfamily enzyme YgiQ (UPF0313 family)
MKMLLVFPPQWVFVAPSVGIPSLIGYINSQNHEAKALDLNIEFFNHVLQPSILENSMKKAKTILPVLKEEFENSNISDISKLAIETRIKFQRYEYIKNNISELEELSKYIIPNITAYSKIPKTKDFYNPDQLYDTYAYFEKAFKIATLPYYPLKYDLFNYVYDNGKFTFDVVKHVCFDEDSNMFINYYKPIVEKLSHSDIDCIGISINGLSQIVPGLTFARMIKEKTSIHVTIGGSHITREDEYIKNNKEFFKLFADSISVGDGEISLTELLNYLEGKTTIDKVPSLIYLDKDDNITANPLSSLPFNKVPTFSFDGMDMDKYFLPDKVLPIQAVQGCYYGKCAFCDYNVGKKYSSKSPEQMVEEIKTLQKKYGVSHFYFIDSGLSPAFLDKFSKKLIEDKIKIHYFSNLRFEKQFTKKLLKQMHKSGMVVCQWGLESASERMLKLINKGITMDVVKRILKDASNVGLMNHVYVIAGLPTETVEDFDKTIEFLHKYKKYIDTVAFHDFCFVKGSYIANNPEKFEITPEEMDELKDSYFSYPKPKYIKPEYIKEKVKETYSIYYKQDSAYTKVSLNLGNEVKFLYSIKYHNKIIRKFLAWLYKL